MSGDDRSSAMLSRFNVLLVSLLVGAALLLVTSQNRARRLTIELERAHGQMRELDVRYSQLQVEITRLAKASRVDELVRRQLHMVSLSPERTIYLKGPN